MSRPAHPIFLQRKHHIYVIPENRASLKDAQFEVQNSSDLRLKLSAKPHFGAGFGALAQRALIDAVEGVTEMLFNIFYRWCLKALNFILNLYNLNIYCICISFNVSISGSYMSLVTCFRVLTPAGSDLCKSRSIEAHDGRCFSL